MAKQYRTARGKSVDLSQILHENEHVRAVGNMNVNARGDTIDSNNKTIESRNERVKKQYRKQHKKSVIDSKVIPTSRRHAKQLEQEQSASDIASSYASKGNTNSVVEEVDNELEKVVVAPTPVDEPVTVEETVTAPAEEPVPATNTSTSKSGGLAAAIAKARESKQELMKTPRQEARETSGVKRI